MHRYAIDAQEGNVVKDKDLQKEMGNIMFSMIRRCDDLGYDPEACLDLARVAQKKI